MSLVVDVIVTVHILAGDAVRLSAGPQWKEAFSLLGKSSDSS